MAMSELLERLRTICGRAYICTSRDDCDDYANCWEHRTAIIDAVERELSERYMELPVDADGVPWHIGDEAIGVNVWRGERFTVGSIELTGDGAQLVDVETVDAIPCGAARHVQPDTWERIIRDAIELGYTDPDNEHLTDRIIARCRALAGENA